LGSTVKHWLYSHYGWLLSLALLVSITLLITFWGYVKDIGIVVTVVGGIVSFAFIIQRQQHEEMKSFRELFSDFNRRYDKINGCLNEIARKPDEYQLTDPDKDLLYDYFNLCSEEYLFFKRGYIYPEVWRAWCNGIRLYLRHPAIARLWELEEKTDSYYGLTLDLIERCASK
jgi:hypothetical protein